MEKPQKLSESLINKEPSGCHDLYLRESDRPLEKL